MRGAVNECSSSFFARLACHWILKWRRKRGCEGNVAVALGILCGLNGTFNHRFPVEVCGPVDQVKSPKEDREHYPGHLVNFADAVVCLFGVHCGLGLSTLQLNSGAVGDGGDSCILCDVGGEVNSG